MIFIFSIKLLSLIGSQLIPYQFFLINLYILLINLDKHCLVIDFLVKASRLLLFVIHIMLLIYSSLTPCIEYFYYCHRLMFVFQFRTIRLFYRFYHSQILGISLTSIVFVIHREICLIYFYSLSIIFSILPCLLTNSKILISLL